MKKLAFIAAVSAATTGAMAQSSVSITGNVDSAIQSGSGSVSDLRRLGSGANSSSRIAIRGTEDLGGGMSAGFWLESGINLDEGSGGATNSNNQSTGVSTGNGLTFGRRSTVSLESNLGELRLGRDYGVHHYNRFELDPFAGNGVAASQATAGNLASITNRVSNSVMYFLPENAWGVFGEAQYYMGENGSAAGARKDDGTGGGFRLGWRNGPFLVSLASAKTSYATTATLGDTTATNLGARYEVGALTLMGVVFRESVDSTANRKGRAFQLGGIYKVGASDFKLQVSRYETNAVGTPESKKLSLGYVYNLSKRTALYASYGRINNSGGATSALNGAVTAANRSSSGYDLGIRHSF